MKIVSIRIKNYKAFRNLELRDLPALAVFIGANGTGKSTLFDVFAFIKESLNHDVRQALARRGGYKEVISRGQGGDIEIELQCGIESAGKARLLTYLLVIGEQGNAPVIKREVLREGSGVDDSSCLLLDFALGKGYAVSDDERFNVEVMESPREEQQLSSPDMLAIKGLGQFKRFKAASVFRHFIENWQVSDFHVADVKASCEAGHAEHLSPTGDNLPLVTQYMQQQHSAVFDEVLKKMSERVPGIESVRAETTIDGRVALRFKDNAFSEPFAGSHVSDGTIKMFAYLLLLNDPAPPPLLCMEEPDEQIYPLMLGWLFDDFQQYVHRGGQLFVSTHSPDLLTDAEPRETYWLEKKDGCTTVHLTAERQFVRGFCESGEKLGYLWKQKYIDHAPPQ